MPEYDLNAQIKTALKNIRAVFFNPDTDIRFRIDGPLSTVVALKKFKLFVSHGRKYLNLVTDPLL